jgi:GntR family transcriptional regulator
MLVSLDPRDARPLYLQIMDEVRRALVTGSLRAEDPVPSVRELAAELAVNPRTVRQAYGELEREGILYVRRGLGTFVAPDARPHGRERALLARGVAQRALLEARRNGLGLEELLTGIRAVAAEEEAEEAEVEPSGPVTAANPPGAANPPSAANPPDATRPPGATNPRATNQGDEPA